MQDNRIIADLILWDFELLKKILYKRKENSIRYKMYKREYSLSIGICIKPKSIDIS